MKRTLLTTAFTLGLAIASDDAFAQDYSFQGFATSEAMNQLNASVRDNMGSSSRTDRSTRAANTPTMRAAPSAVSSTRYTATADVSQRVQEQFIEFVSDTADANAGNEVRLALRRGDPIRDWSAIVSGDGLRTGDAADAFAAYWVLNWVIANQGDNNRAQTIAVRDQVRGTMANSSGFSRLDNEQRQEMSEALMLNFLAQQAAYSDALRRGDQSAMRALGNAAVRRFQHEMGVDLRQLRLTDQGFVPGD